MISIFALCIAMKASALTQTDGQTPITPTALVAQDDNSGYNIQDQQPACSDASMSPPPETPDVSENVTMIDGNSFVRPNGEVVTLPPLSTTLPLEADRLSDPTYNSYASATSMNSRPSSHVIDVSLGVTRSKTKVRFTKHQGNVAGSNDKSGPFWRTLTKSGYFGYVTMIALPRDPDIFPNSLLISHPSYNDICYVYLGGWAPHTTASDGAIDFGLQFSAKRRVWDAAGLFYRAGKGPDGKPVKSQAFSSPLGILPGHFVGIGFYLYPRDASQALATDPTTRIRAYIVDCGVDGRSPGVSLQKDFTVSSAAGWNTLGGGGTGQFFKRMVTIGQGAGLEGTRETYFYHTQCLDSDVGLGGWINIVYRAIRDQNGRLTLNPGTSYPATTFVDWSLRNSTAGPIYGWYVHPQNSETGGKSAWTKPNVVRVNTYPLPANDGYYNYDGSQPTYSSASIDCQGNAHG